MVELVTETLLVSESGETKINGDMRESEIEGR